MLMTCPLQGKEIIFLKSCCSTQHSRMQILLINIWHNFIHSCSVNYRTELCRVYLHDELPISCFKYWLQSELVQTYISLELLFSDKLHAYFPISSVPDSSKSHLYDNYQFVQDTIIPRLIDITQLEKNSEFAHLESQHSPVYTFGNIHVDLPWPQSTHIWSTYIFLYSPMSLYIEVILLLIPTVTSRNWKTKSLKRCCFFHCTTK